MNIMGEGKIEIFKYIVYLFLIGKTKSDLLWEKVGISAALPCSNILAVTPTAA